MHMNAAVPLREPVKPVRLWMQVDPLRHPKDEGDTVRVHMDLSREEAAFLDALALYWNALHKEKTGKRRKVLYVRKTAAERLMSAQIDGYREQLRQMFAAVGPFPQLGHTKESKDRDRELMAKYVKRVVAWDEKAFGK